MDSEAVNNQKRCPRCGEFKPATLEYFNHDKNRADGLYPQCKICYAAYRRARFEALQQPDNLEKFLQYKQQQQEASHRYNTTQKAHERSRRYTLRHPDKRQVLEALRCAAGSVTATDVNRLWDEQSGCCAYCCRSLHNLKVEVDHIQPVSRGGMSDAVNLCLACRKCNRSKHNKTLQEWVNRWYEKRADEG